MTMPSERDPVNAGRTRRGPAATIAGVVLVLAILAIGYMVFFSNAGDGPVVGSSDAGAVTSGTTPAPATPPAAAPATAPTTP